MDLETCQRKLEQYVEITETELTVNWNPRDNYGKEDDKGGDKIDPDDWNGEREEELYDETSPKERAKQLFFQLPEKMTN